MAKGNCMDERLSEGDTTEFEPQSMAKAAIAIKQPGTKQSVAAAAHSNIPEHAAPPAPKKTRLQQHSGGPAEGAK